MTQYDNRNRGILSRNDRKAKDTHPDHTGTLNVDGVDYYIDAWVKERKDGSGKFFSLSVKRKDKQGGAPAPVPRDPAPRAPSGGYSDEDSEIPFAPLASGRSFLAV